MSDSTTTTRPGLGSGLARCHVPTAADGLVVTTTGSDYSAPVIDWSQRALPVRPPPPASVMHRCRELRFPPISHSYDTHSTAAETAVKSRAVGCTDRESSPPAPPSTNRRNEAHLHISADRRLETCSTTTGANFQPTPRMLPTTLIRKPAADRSKCCPDDDWSTCATAQPRRHTSQDHRVEPRERYVVTKNAGCCPITGSSKEVKVQGRGEETVTTTNCTTYRGHAVRAGDRKWIHSSKPSSIPQGDVCKAEKPCTTSRATYQPPQPTPPGTHYSRLSAVTATFHSSVHFGGTSDTSRTPSVIQREGKDRPPAGRVEGSKVRGQRTRVKRVHRNSSFLPSGDMDVERVRERMSHSTTKKTHQVPPVHGYPSHVDSTRLHTASSVHLGHHHLHPPSSTMTTSYQPLTTHHQRVGPPLTDNIPFDYYPGHLSDSTAASSYRSHSGDLRHHLAPSTLKNLKTSHLQLSCRTSTLPPQPAAVMH